MKHHTWKSTTKHFKQVKKKIMHNTKFSFWVAIFILFISLNACKRNITTEKDMEEQTWSLEKWLEASTMWAEDV